MIQKLVTMFAGFQWPRLHASMPDRQKTVMKRAGVKPACGPLYHECDPDCKWHRFYLSKDGSGHGFTRYDFVVRRKHIRFTTMDDSTVEPIVVRLPHNQFAAGWSMGYGMAAALDTSTVYTDIHEAEDAAIDHAERVAEQLDEQYMQSVEQPD